MILLLLAALTAVPATTAVWLFTTVRSSEAVTDLVAPAHTDRELARSIAVEIGARDDQGDVEGVAFRDEFNDAVVDAITSPSFEEPWREAVADAHASYRSAANGSPGDATMRLDGLAEPLEDEFPALDLPSNEYDVVVVNADYQEQVENVDGLINTLAWLLPLLAVAMTAGGIALARNRWRGVGVGGVALAVVAAISSIVTVVVPGAIVRAAAPSESRSVAEGIVERAGFNLLKVLVVVLLLGLAAAASGFVIERRKRTLQPPPAAWPGV